jgi:hypothetical protein
MKLNKSQLDTAISMEKAYWESYDKSAALNRAMFRSRQMFLEKTFGFDVGYILGAFIGNIIGCLGLNREATNEDIYRALNAVGIEVE